MLQLLYIFAFTVIAFLAFGNLFRSLLTLGLESQRPYRSNPSRPSSSGYRVRSAHPELLDETGNLIDEPLLVMRSISVEDAREQLNDLYNASSEYGDEARGEV